MRPRIQKTLPLVVVTIALSGCQSEEYHVIIENAGLESIQDARINYEQFSFDAGIVIPGSFKGYLFPDAPIPERAVVEWRTEDGVRHRQEVEVKKLIPKRFRGDIVFEIHDDNTVTVRVVPRAKGEY